MRCLGVLALLVCGASAFTAGFIKSPLSEVKLIEDDLELHCEVVGSPTPEIQWWYVEGNDSATFVQLYDGARQDRVKLNSTYKLDAKSSIYVMNLTIGDSGTYECRANNDPDRNDLQKRPRIKWIRSQATVIILEYSSITTESFVSADGENALVLSCNLTNPSSEIKGRVWKKDGADITDTNDEDSSPLMQHKLQSVDAKTSGLYSCVYGTIPPASATLPVRAAPGVTTYKKSEHGNEGDMGLLTCKSHGYPPVESWTWSRSTKDGGVEHIMNGTNNRFQIKIIGNKTELHILALDIEKDQGSYYCNATNEIGARAEIIHLRVRGRFAALWPFLGIVAEVIVLVTIIFIYEKRRKPDEITDDDEQGSAPLKSNAATNHKDKNVRQRNAN